ncbi:DUF3310 domain-containing protein [Weissella soli]|nr:DUF3310 domain-containing protein [Weissella soli]
MDHNKDKLKKGVELYIEAIDDEPVDEFDDVTHPAHYTQYSFEAIDIIDEVAPKYPVEVAMEIGNAIKYLLRAPFKGRLVQDLNKAVWYINRAIRNLETES